MVSGDNKVTERSSRLFFYLACFLLAATFFNTAWVSDDAYISFRAIDNFLNGYGPVWNVEERVQVYTHPLWFLLLSALTVLLEDPYWASLALSAVCLAGSVFFIRASARSDLSAGLVVVGLSFSKIFIDYSSSGLENPLTHFLLSSLFFFYFKIQDSCDCKNLKITIILCSLLTLNRFDLVLVAIPVIFFCLKQCKVLGFWSLARILILYFAPIFAWVSFATIYYGTPLPNTYFAKLSTQVDQSDLLVQGGEYLVQSFKYDPSSILILFVGIVFGFFGRLLPFSIGVVVYLLYVTKNGGDFMVGRFYSAPVLVSFLILLHAPVNAYRRTLLLVGVAAAGFNSLFFTLMTPMHYSAQSISPSGIADERGFYYQHTALRRNIKKPRRKEHYFAQLGLQASKTEANLVETCNVGLFGFYSDRSMYIVDGYGLTDPLLARLPAMSPWRVGHFERSPPKGYYKALNGDDQGLADEQLNKLWELLKVTHRAELFSEGRLGAIVELHLTNWDQRLTESEEFNDMRDLTKQSKFHCRNNYGAYYQVID